MQKKHMKIKYIYNILTRNRTEEFLQNMNSISRLHLQHAPGLQYITKSLQCT